MFEAILFDMDGVLVDSEEYICKAAIEMFKEMQVETNPDDFLPFVGAGENNYIGGVAEKYGLSIDIEAAKSRTYEIYGKMVKGNLDPLPGTVEYIDNCKKKGIKLALATSADKTKMLINLKEIGIGPENFGTVINGLDIEKKKPHPDIYLLAADRLDVKYENCLVVEDAINGVKSGVAAGMEVLGLTTSFTGSQLKNAGAQYIAKDLSDANKKGIY